ncbi:hypothetical protein CEXT_357461 [Caerostris extrusa]|uniref:Uncharacterized protein n=1 Tax=Caerostris extrusa TaxID=172846 RepID=A0AAV4U4E3_CAEEX|nr:hypothetical protein CEXT_357461 [Caerostris extrusa]
MQQQKHFKFKSAEIQNRSNSSNLLFRSLSLPNRRTFTYNWLQTWLWKCHSLEDWLWYLEEQPCESRDFSQINILPNDYKLVYVSSSSDSEDSSLDCCDFPKHYFVQNDVTYSDTNTILNSSLKMNYDTSCTADSDWELESVDSDDSDLFLSLNKNENLIQVTPTLFIALLSPSSVDPTHRGNDKSATGWGKQRCSIASRVIDLNLRALECGREVLDVADLTPLLGWVAVAAKHGGINAFFYHAPPVASKPEADYLLRLTRSDPCLLFQRSPHASGVACVIAVEAVSAVDYVSKFRLDERTKGANAMQLEDEKSLVQNIPQCSELISYVPAASRLGEATETSAQTAADGAEKSRTGTCERVSKLYPILNLVESDINRTVNICTQSVDSSTKISFNQDIPESLKCFDADILSCVRNIFFDEFSAESEYFCKNELFVNFPSTIYDCSDAFERVDCHCNKPCDVPSSPSVVDATRSLGDDGEILSSGDELDKLESDTDSQDTVIEGEAYKRIRSVAIKEKILHANEELFGVNVKESFCDNSGSNKFSDISSAEVSSENPYNVKEIVRKTHQNLFHHEPNTKSSSYSSLEEVNNLQKNKINEVESSDCSGSSNEASTSSSYKVSFCENICSSESSDNGSDGEEVILSDTSTSSDEATYIAPSAAFRYYNYSHSYRLHTIAEESCEESEKKFKKFWTY